jgi:hypothetical protein
MRMFSLIKNFYKSIFEISYSRTRSDNVDTTAKKGGRAQTANASSETGNATSIIAEKVYLGDSLQPGRRRKAIKELKQAAIEIRWAIEQSKNPKVGNTPYAYLKKLKTVYKKEYEFLNETDLKLLEPLITAVTDFRKEFLALETPLEELFEVLDTLK